jgi:hypothetical protein
MKLRVRWFVIGAVLGFALALAGPRIVRWWALDYAMSAR